MRLLSWIIFFLVVLAEGTITTLPLTLLFLICLTVIKRQEWIFFLAFFAGILLDVFALRQVGGSSVFFIVFLFFILLYQRKYETSTMPFVLIATFFGCYFYASFIGISSAFLVSVISTGIIAVAFSQYRRTKQILEIQKFRSV